MRRERPRATLLTPRRTGLVSPLVFTYQDADGDAVTIANQADLDLALMDASGPLVITVKGSRDGDSDSEKDAFEFVELEFEDQDRVVSQSDEQVQPSAMPTASIMATIERSSTPESSAVDNATVVPSEVGEIVDDENIFHDATASLHVPHVDELNYDDNPSVMQNFKDDDEEEARPPVLEDQDVAPDADEADDTNVAEAHEVKSVLGSVVVSPADIESVRALLGDLLQAVRLSDEERGALAIRLLAQPSVVQATCSALASKQLQDAVVDSALKEVAGEGSFANNLVQGHMWTLMPILAALARTGPDLVNIGGMVLEALSSKPAPAPSAAVVAATPPPPKPVHSNVVCDGCESRPTLCEQSVANGNRTDQQYIAGVRYKSTMLRNFDLCETCEASGEFDATAGPMIKIKHPEMAARITVVPSQPEVVPSPPAVRPAPPPPPRETVPTVIAAQPSAPPAPPAKTEQAASLACPHRHSLRQFVTPHGQFKCNVCGLRQAPGTIMFGCRPCDFDICIQCSEKNGAGMPQAKFVADMTLTDGSLVDPGGVYVKTWRVRNSSPNIVWPADARLVNIGGAPLGAPVEGFSVPQARPGEIVDISCELKMPMEPGKYTSFWRLVTGPPTHARFGHRMWVTVNVRDALPANVTEDAVAQMVDAGFTDVDSIVRNLGATNGNVQDAISRMQTSATEASAPDAMQNLDEATQHAVSAIVDVGFTDVDQILRVLAECGGDANVAIERLLGTQ